MFVCTCYEHVMLLWVFSSKIDWHIHLLLKYELKRNKLKKSTLCVCAVIDAFSYFELSAQVLHLPSSQIRHTTSVCVIYTEEWHSIVSRLISKVHFFFDAHELVDKSIFLFQVCLIINRKQNDKQTNKWNKRERIEQKNICTREWLHVFWLNNFRFTHTKVSK